MPILITTEQVPEWAVNYIEYGDPSGLSEDEIEEIDEWLSDNFPSGFIADFQFNDTTEFCTRPLFGKAAKTITTHFYEP